MKLISILNTITSNSAITEWVGDKTSDIVSAIGDQIFDVIDYVIERLLFAFAPIIALLSELVILVCVTIFVLTNDQKMATKAFKWFFIFIISLAWESILYGN